MTDSSVGGTGYIGFEEGSLDQLQGLNLPNGTYLRFGYDGDNIIGEYLWTPSIGASMLRRYVYGPGTDEPLVWYEGAGLNDKRYLHTDERGSVAAVSDNAGSVLAVNRYDEYGIPASSNVGRFQYSEPEPCRGHGEVSPAWLAEVGLYYYKARIYSPTLGRFLQTDPIGYEDQINLYTYVANDPVNKVDPTGESCEGLSNGDLRAYCDPENPEDDGPPIVVTGDKFGSDLTVNDVGNIIGRAALDLDGLRQFFCSLPSIDIGFGADLYAGLGGSVGGSGKIDIASGQIGIGFNIAVGAALGAEVGPSVGASPSGSGVVSLNLTTSAGLGFGVGGVATRNIIGTDPGQTSGSVGRAGTPIGFVNGGAAAGFSTPRTNPLGCK